MPKKWIIILLLSLSIALLSASKLAEKIESDIRAAQDSTSAMAVITGYIAQTDDIEDLRILQNYWLQIDDQGCMQHFTTLKKKNPKDPKYIYLWARTLVEIEDMMKVARKLIKKHPDFEYSYRLLLAPYQKNLFALPNDNDVKKSPVYKDYLKDKKYFDAYLKRYPNEENALYLQISRYVWEQNVTQANLLVATALEKKATFLGWQFYTDFYLRTKQLPLLQAYIRKMIDESKKSEGMSMAEKESQYNLIYLGFLFENGSYPEYLAYIKEHPAVINGTEIKQMTLLVYTKTNDIEAAFGLIDTLMDQPNQFYSWLSTDMELAPLMTDPRWAAKLEQMKGLWELGAGDRKSAVIAKKFSRPAPLWSLKDTAGNTINLADLKGQVVILDFWATWCGPCKMAMPVIDEWMKTKMPAGVKVFSVNVWERDPSKAQPFMEQNGYGMTLLYGYNDLSKEYGFDGIPYLCVIDKEGNIRFEETGFAEELAENLGFWTEDLLK